MPRRKNHAHRVYQVIGEPEPGALVAGYARYSSELQDPVSILTQKRRIQEYCDRKGWIIIRWYEEPERSAKYEDIEQRPIFAQLLADAGGDFQVVVCYMNNRWARNAAVAFTSLSQLRRKRVWWATSDGLWDIDKVQQDGFDVAFAVDTQMNAAYVRQLSKRVIDAKEDRARDGYHNGQTPFGYLPPAYPKAPDGAPSTWKPPRTPVRIDPDNFPALVRLGELAAQGWSDAAIADELAGHVSATPRFGQRALTKDTIAAIRRMWFPREFAAGCGHGTIETPSGELVEGRHQAAWPYDLWQRIIEVKAGQYRRPQREAQRRAHEFSRIIVCASCRRALRADSYDHKTYYRDTSRIRKLPCSAIGSLHVRGSVVVTQFGQLLAGVQLPSSWHEAVAQRCEEASYDASSDQVQQRRADLEAEQKRLVQAFAKGYLPERDLDAQVDRIRAELQTLPSPTTRTADECTQAAIVAGETLTDMASYWDEALPEERRDIVWVLLQLGGLLYDLERRAIVGLLPRPDMLHVLALGLSAQWERHGDELRLRAEFIPPKLERSEMTLQPDQRKLSATEREAARQLLAEGKSMRQVAAHFHVSRMAIWRIAEAHPRRDGLREDKQQGGDA
jgi:DNA invertase Pin-like site-specific DNA recombinase